MRYKVGDRVRITTDKSKSDKWNLEGEMDKWLGKVMTIKYVGWGYYEMEEDYDEHEGGWFWFEEMIDGLADEHKIVIITDGKTTTAKLYDGKKFIKTATAKCSPEDEFDFRTGAERAVERLFDKNKGKYFTGKAVRTREDRGFTKGRIYDFENGVCFDDDYDKRPIGCGHRGFLVSELEENGFIAIKE